MSTWLSEREERLVDGAEKLDFQSPVPTQIVSNGEYLPPPQSPIQKKVEDRIKELADDNSKYLFVPLKNCQRSLPKEFCKPPKCAM